MLSDSEREYNETDDILWNRYPLKTVSASVRFVVGDVVTWISKSGSKHTGTVVSIKEGSSDDLITCRLADGQYRSFYDNATDWVMWG